ncbi:MAG: hypothetical protein CME62_12625 [Halobacteriovoraceae bacterium]|nr:hypothetical protein [Halobacteriovoraceae bacterium]
MKQTLLMTIFFLMLSCNLELIIQERSDLEFADSQSFALSSSIDFAEIKKEILTPHCIDCHRDYSQYEAVFDQSKQIQEEIENNRMPKNQSPLTRELKQMVNSWVSAGAPFSVENQKPDEIKLAPHWESLSQKVFFPKCVRCHNPNGQASFFPLDKYEDFVKNQDYLLNNFEDVENSLLVEVLTDPVEPMPPIWSELERVSAEELAVIKEWIKNKIPRK